MFFKTKDLGYILCCVALSLVLGISVFFSLVCVGVIAEDKKNNPATESQEPPLQTEQQNNNDFSSEYNQGDFVVDENTGAVGVVIEKPTVENNTPSVEADTNAPVSVTAQDIVNIYATVMNGAKEKKPGFKKIEYQVLPEDPQNRVITEGESAVTGIMNVVKDLGVFVPEADARSNPYVHTKGDSDMSYFPVFFMEKGSYLTDPNGIHSYVYEELDNGNVRVKFVLVTEDNPEPVAQGESVAPSYTGAVFSPMSKAKIDRTLNAPIIAVIATNISYTLRYHDCYVEFEYNPDTMELVSLSHVAYVTIKGSGDMLFGKVNVEKQELESYVFIDEFSY